MPQRIRQHHSLYTCTLVRPRYHRPRALDTALLTYLYLGMCANRLDEATATAAGYAGKNRNLLAVEAQTHCALPNGQADAPVHIGIALVRLFAGGHVALA